jgi:hypothetical protein
MQTYELTIAAKVKPNPFNIVSAADFQVQPGRALDPQVVFDQPNLSLYCLDHANQRALFVDTPPEVDLVQAPFYLVTPQDRVERRLTCRAQ